MPRRGVFGRLTEDVALASAGAHPAHVVEAVTQATGRSSRGRKKSEPRGTHCGKCTKRFEEDSRRHRSTLPGDENLDDICAACYQKAYRIKHQNSTVYGPCGKCHAQRTTGYWARSQVPPTKGLRICQKCYDDEKRSRDTARRSVTMRCARCDKVGTGSEKTFWYRGEREPYLKKHVCKQCHLLDYRDRLNEDPNVFCGVCRKSELRSRNWRKRKGGGYICDGCYKRDRLERMNKDPSVVCALCNSTTCAGPEWRRIDGKYMCRMCLKKRQEAARKAKKTSRKKAT